MRIDRLSSLPDSLLIRVLSFLSMKEAVKTAVLSKRWQFVWSNMRSFELSEGSRVIKKIRKFVGWVHRTLVMCSGNLLEKLDVEFIYDKRFASDVNVWVEFAVKNKVKEVALVLNSSGDLYELPQMMYCNASLEFLHLESCIFAPRRNIDWGSLKTLWLDKVDLRCNVMEKVFSSCPVLDGLALTECRGLDVLKINSRSLKELLVRDVNNDSLLEISAPYLHTLGITIDPEGRKWQPTNISSLVVAEIEFIEFPSDPSSTKMMSYTKELLESFKHVEKLRLWKGCIEVLSMLVEKGGTLPRLQVKDLTVNATRHKESVHGIAVLLESSPNVETLEINWIYDPFEASVTSTPAAPYLTKDDLNRDLSHLKTIEITNSGNQEFSSEPMLTLVELLLKRATTLEEIVIDVGDFTAFASRHASNEYVKMAQKLLRFPRSSRDAEVVLQ